MDFLPKSIHLALEELSRLPGIGPKSAQRLAFWLLKRSDVQNQSLGDSILGIKHGVMTCEVCFSLASEPRCAICSNTERDQSQLCVIESTLDLIALERSGAYHGLYHVLGGKLSPLEGVGPEDLRIAELFERLTAEGNPAREVILALNPDLEGDTTALFLQRKLAGFHSLSLTRIARGIPSGGHLEYTDDATLIRALQGRQSL